MPDRTSPSTYERELAAKKATNTLTKHFADRQVCDALHTRNGPHVTDILSSAIRHALVYLTEKDCWDGPYTILDIDRDDVYYFSLTVSPKFDQQWKPYVNPAGTDTKINNSIPIVRPAVSEATAEANATFVLSCNENQSIDRRCTNSAITT